MAIIKKLFVFFAIFSVLGSAVAVFAADKGGYAGSQYQDECDYSGSQYVDEGGSAGSQYQDDAQAQSAASESANVASNAPASHGLFNFSNLILILLVACTGLGGYSVLKKSKY